MSNVELDRTNLKIVELLQRDGRMSITDLAAAVHRAESTVRERLVSLERNGVIRGFHADIDMTKLGYSTHAFLQADCRMGSVSDLAKRLEGIPNITRATLTTGPKPLVVEIWAQNLPQLEGILEKRIAPLELERIESRLIVQQLVEQRPVIVPETEVGAPASPTRTLETVIARSNNPTPQP